MSKKDKNTKRIEERASRKTSYSAEYESLGDGPAREIRAEGERKMQQRRANRDAVAALQEGGRGRLEGGTGGGEVGGTMQAYGRRAHAHGRSFEPTLLSSRQDHKWYNRDKQVIDAPPGPQETLLGNGQWLFVSTTAGPGRMVRDAHEHPIVWYVFLGEAEEREGPRRAGPPPV